MSQETRVDLFSVSPSTATKCPGSFVANHNEFLDWDKPQ